MRTDAGNIMLLVISDTSSANLGNKYVITYLLDQIEQSAQLTICLFCSEEDITLRSNPGLF